MVYPILSISLVFFAGYTQGYTTFSSMWTVVSASNVLSTTAIRLKLHPNAYTPGT